MQNMGFWILNDVVWSKLNPTPNMAGTRFCNSHETLLWCSKGEGHKFTFNYKTAKELNLDAIHDTVHEMAKDEARHGRGFDGLLARYFA